MKKGSTFPKRVTSWTRRSTRARQPDAVSQTDIERKPDYLQEPDIFAPLSPDERKWLLENTTMVTCERGRVFYGPEDVGEVVFILKRGKVNLYRLTADGRKLVTATFSAHTVFGEMGLIGQRMYGCYAEAAEDCLLCVLSRSDMQNLIRRNPEVGLLLLAEVERRFQEREAELVATAFRGLPARLAALLLREADASGTISGLSHQDLAERLGTYRETISQLLGRFRDEGLLSIEPKRIRLIDLDGVRAYAHSD
jgi:CRP/FNR family cyclic AMP-dependent transcriptional regulator